MGIIHRQAGHAFFHKLGASRLMTTICGPAAGAGFQAGLGGGPSTGIESAAASDFILIWGSSTLSTNLLTSQRLTDAGEICAFHCNRVEVAPK